MKLKRKNMNDEIKDAIRNQVTFLSNSCFLYDKGCHEEAIRIASSLNVLLESRTGGSKGILRKLDNKVKLLSSIPYQVKEAEVNKLEIRHLKTVQELNSINENESVSQEKIFTLIYIEENNTWHVRGVTNDGEQIDCDINELRDKLELPKGWILMVPFWINKYSNNEMPGGIKKAIYSQFSWLFGYPDKYVPGLYFPLVKSNFGIDNPTLSHNQERLLDIDEWLCEIIFSVSDENRDNHILTRKLLIESVRDKDGGGHFDFELDLMSYYKSKYGEKLGTLDSGDITTKNYHLIMLRQLGYEILNSRLLESIEK